MTRLRAAALGLACALAGALASLTWAPAGAAPASSPAALAQCFGHRGIHITGFIAGECVFQPAGLGGALYWSFNESNFNWDKHPGPGLLWVEASTLHPAADTNPPNPFQAFWVGIPVAVNAFGRIVSVPLWSPAPPTADFCNVVNPGVSNRPTTCAVDGVVQTMPAQVQASYGQFAAAMQAAALPFCAWSDHPVPNEAACDVDA